MWAETGAVPTDDSLGFHDDQNIFPAGPEVAQGGPEESVQPVQRWSRPLAFEHGNLLSQGQNFQGRIASALAEDADHREHGQDEFGRAGENTPI